MQWFSCLTRQDFDTVAWDPYPELEVMAWRHNTYLNPAVEGPSFLIPAANILSQVCWLTLSMHEARTEEVGSDNNGNLQEQTRMHHQGLCTTVSKVWLTAGFTRVCVYLCPEGLLSLTHLSKDVQVV